MAATFLYEAAVVEVLMITPGAGPIAGSPVVILGRGFQVGATVTFGGAAATGVTVVSAARLECTSPAHAVGAVDVVVTNPDTTDGAMPGGFTYEVTPPTRAMSYRTPFNTPASRIRTETSAPQIQQTLGQPSMFTFTAADEPAGRQQVEFRAYGISLFRGIVTHKSERIEGADRLQVWDVEATDFADLLMGVHPEGEWADVSGTLVITELLAFAPAFSNAGVEIGLGDVTLSLDGTMDLWAAILDVCGQCGAKAFLDGVTLYVFTESSSLPGPDPVTEANPDLLWPEGGQNPVAMDWDYKSIHNAVTVRGAEGIRATLEDHDSIRTFGRREWVVNDNTLTTQPELIARAQSVLESDAFPIAAVRYATRDLLTHVGADVQVEIERPAISGTFVIHTVVIDQVDALEKTDAAHAWDGGVGARPRFTVTAKPAAASFKARGDVVGLLQSVIDLTANADKSPRLAGDVVSEPGGRTTIPDGSIPATKLAGCIDSDKLEPTAVTPGPYGDAAHLTTFTVDAAGRITAAATDPVAIAKTDGSQPYTADQPMGGHTLTGLGAPVAAGDAATKASSEAAAAAAAAAVTPATLGLVIGTHVQAFDAQLAALAALADAAGVLTNDGAGALSWEAPGGGGTPAVSGEIPTGAINGVNLVFTTAADYAGLRVFKNGQRLTLGDDYTETAADSFTLAVAPVAPDVILVDYFDATGVGFTPGDGLDLAAGVLDVVLDGASLTNGPAGLKVTAPPGALILLEEHIAAASASLAFTTRNKNGYTGATFQADFDEYEIHLIGLLPASNDVNCRLRMSTNGGSSYDAGANYSQTFSWQATNNDTARGGGTGGTYADMGGNINSAATGGLHGRYTLFDPLSPTAHKTLIGRSSFLHTTIGRMGWDRALHYLSASAVNAFAVDLVAATGGAAVNITSGAIRVYGIAK